MHPLHTLIEHLRRDLLSSVGPVPISLNLSPMPEMDWALPRADRRIPQQVDWATEIQLVNGHLNFRVPDAWLADVLRSELRFPLPEVEGHLRAKAVADHLKEPRKSLRRFWHLLEYLPDQGLPEAFPPFSKGERHILIAQEYLLHKFELRTTAWPPALLAQLLEQYRKALLEAWDNESIDLPDEPERGQLRVLIWRRQRLWLDKLLPALTP